MRNLKYHLSIYLVIGLIYNSYSQEQSLLTTGPENGSLVIVGGGQVGEKITTKFIEPE